MDVHAYRKLLISLLPVVASGLVAFQHALDDDTLDPQDLAAVAVAVLTAAGVWAASYPQVKGVVALLGAAATAYAVALTDDTVTSSEWVSVVLAGLAAVGVFAVPNRPETEPVQQVEDPGPSPRSHR